jgi:plastocyanin
MAPLALGRRETTAARFRSRPPRNYPPVTARLIMGLVVLAVVGSSGTTVGRSANTATTRLTVTGGEYWFKLSRARVPRGTVYVTFVNTGSESHDLKFTGKSPMTKVLAPNAKQTIKLVFKKPGRYAFLCTVGEHALKGMNGTLIVR